MRALSMSLFTAPRFAIGACDHRTRGRLVALIGVLISLAAWAPTNAKAQGRTADPERPYNILFLMCDDLNTNLGCYSHWQVESPNLDRLAARGTLFSNAHCQYPLCGPSRASMMTGLYPDQTLMTGNAVYVRRHTPDVVTLSQYFRRRGYFATRIGKIYHYNVPLHVGTSGHDDPESWDYTINPRGRDRDELDETFTIQAGRYGGTLSWLAAEGSDDEQTDGIAAIEAMERLEHHAQSDEPFFLAVGLYRPHTPYTSPRPYFERYPTDSVRVPTIPDGYYDTLPQPARNSVARRDQVNLEERLKREALQAYYASITFADRQLGRILDKLEETGLADRTIIVFTSDHGYHMGEHGHFQKMTLFNDATQVPLIIAVPGLTHGERAATGAELIDLYPTLVELCGYDRPEHLSGVSLVPALRDPSNVVRDSVLTRMGQGYTVRNGRYRFTQWGEDGANGVELYDREKDPEELVNLATRPDYQEALQEMSALLKQRVEAARVPPPGVRQVQ